MRVQGDDLCEENCFGFFGIAQQRMQFYGEISAGIDQTSPQFSAFPPSFIGGIGSENQQHRNDKAKEAMQYRKVFHRIPLAELKVVQLQIGDQPGVDADGDHHRKKLTDGVRLMQPEDESEPVFWIVGDQFLSCLVVPKIWK